MQELTPEQKAALFPAECHFKVIARDLPGMQDRLTCALRAAGVHESLSPGNRSAAGTYITYNMSILVGSYEEMRSIDCALRAVSGVRLVL
jgi:putative lipoic acid-binding regulatory protein